MAKINSIPSRVDKKFLDELNFIKMQRMKLNKDEMLKPVKMSRLTLAITRHPHFKKIKLDIINSDLK